MAKAPQLSEKQWFEADPQVYTTTQEKNDRLSDLLTQTWNNLNIVSIRRIDIAAQGWEATYRS